MSVDLKLVKNTLTQGKVWKFWKVTAKSKVIKNCKMSWNLSIKSGQWVWIYSSQREIEYFSPVIPYIRAIVKTHPSLLHNLLYFSPALPFRTIIFTRHPTPQAWQGSAVHIFLVNFYGVYHFWLQTNTGTLQLLQERTWLIHWSLFVFFNHPKGRDLIIDLFLYQPQ